MNLRIRKKKSTKRIDKRMIRKIKYGAIKRNLILHYGISNELRFLQHCIDYTSFNTNYPVDCVVYCRPDEIRSYGFVDWLVPRYTFGSNHLAVGMYWRRKVHVFFIGVLDPNSTTPAIVCFNTRDDSDDIVS